MQYKHFHLKHGLYDPRFEHSSCGVGFVCNVKGGKSHTIIKQGLKVLERIAHRGATGSDPKTGDGAGILIQIPHQFFSKVCEKNKIDLPNAGEYGTGLIFLPSENKEYQFCKDIFSKIIEQEGQVFLGWRQVPVDNSNIGKGARDTEPIIEQIFIAKNKAIKKQLDFERKLYIIRKQVENIIRDSNISKKTFFYITNISSRTFSYKGLLMPGQLENFFLDLKDEEMSSALCLVHSRYSTNTFPTWDLAQPFRFLAHNGEINTLRGNINWMRAREGLLRSSLFAKDIDKIKPILREGLSDSATIDNALELLVLGGRGLVHSMMMLIPAAWENNDLIDEKVRDFYRYHGCFIEPWDGPASIAFTDGIHIGAVLDRNGLRPSRYIITKDDLVVMASEVGVLDIKPESIVSSGRLEPGKIFYIDTEEERIIDDKEIKQMVSSRKPYGLWIKKNMVDIDELSGRGEKVREKEELITLLKAFGYSREDLRMLIKPMAQDGKEPTGSMGDDVPLAVLSRKPRLLYDYFKQLFAQVTNPAIDPIREELVMSLESFIGPQKNILDETPEHAHKLRVKHPILTNEDLAKISNIKQKGFKTKTISILFRADNKKNFLKTLERICVEATSAIKHGYSFIILTDRGVNKEFATLPVLLATGAVHHHLVREELRTQIGIIVESGEPRETQHFAILFGYGADCINPYLAYETVTYLVKENRLDLNEQTALHNYIKAIEKGILKILSKMGISTLQSYRGAQIFEALGLNQDVIDRCFAGTVSRIGGADFQIITKESILRHQDAYPEREIGFPYLATGGMYQWKKDGEFHLWNPESITALQQAARKNDYKKYKEFAELINPVKNKISQVSILPSAGISNGINNQSANPTTLRSLLKFKQSKSIPINQVEPIEKIVQRFVVAAMSFGSISKSAHEFLAIAMNRLGGKSNTGEGGEDPARFKPLSNGDSARSAIKEVASGRFGVTTNYLINADELQIKIAQGAKPGEGGQLPGHKVSEIIARTRWTTPGVTLISPPPHHDIYSIEDLAQLIFDLKNVNPRAKISVKLVSEIGVGTIAAGVVKGHADAILISGGGGGTGASPKSSIRHAGLPWELGLSETHQTLVLNDLRGRVRLRTDGQMCTGRDVAIAALLGAEEYGFCTSSLIVLGCVMERNCYLNSCSIGIATQDEILQQRFRGSPEHLINYFYFVAQELREIMAELGIKKIDEMIGRTELLEVNYEIIPWKANDIDYSKILSKPRVPKTISAYCTTKQNHNTDKVLDRKLIKLAKLALEKAEFVKIELEIKNVDRTIGAMLSGEVCKRYGEKGLPKDTIYCKFNGVAGQSFGAFLAKGIIFELEGLANDYIGKGISGGKIIIYPGKKVNYKPEENIIIGNTTFYGAISGEAYIRGVAGERFCIRNSGLRAVVEGVGDHGCEYMTGGRVIILGKIGRNFAAGMSGGIAYVYLISNEICDIADFKNRCNMAMIELEELDKDDKATINQLLSEHLRYTCSTIAKKVLDNFDYEIKRFVKVMPLEYKRILEGRKIKEKLEFAEEVGEE